MKRPSFLALPRPVATCIVGERTIENDIALIKNADYAGAPGFAVHLEYLENQHPSDDDLRRLISCTKKPVMILRYRASGNLTDEERVDLLKRAIACGAAATDFTADTFDASPLEFSTNQTAIDRQMRAIDEVHEMGGEVVMSSHIAQSRTCEQVVEHLLAVEKRGADYAKIVTMANTEEEFLEAIRTTMTLRRELKVPFIHLCSGQFGHPQRFLGPKLGSAMTFCVESYTPALTVGQLPIANMTAVLNNMNWHIDQVEN